MNNLAFWGKIPVPVLLFFWNTKVKKNAVIIEHAVKAVKEKGVHLETSNCECKPLTGNFWRNI